MPIIQLDFTQISMFIELCLRIIIVYNLVKQIFNIKVPTTIKLFLLPHVIKPFVNMKSIITSRMHCKIVI